jgi:hypothetical protein
MIERLVDEMAVRTTLRKGFTTRGTKLPPNRIFYTASTADHGDMPTPWRMRA